MKKVVEFTRMRGIFIILSLALIITGGVSIATKGMNLGIDFTAGINQRIQIAPPALRIRWIGSENDKATLNVGDGTLYISIKGDERDEINEFPFSEYTNIRSLAGAVSAVEGISISAEVDELAETSALLALDKPAALTSADTVINIRKSAVSSSYIDIEEVRAVLSGIEGATINYIGDKADQEFTIRVQDPGDENFRETVKETIMDTFSAKFGADYIIEKETEYIGPSQAKDLLINTGLLFGVVLFLILVYIWFRFKMAYAVAAITALLHDVSLMFGFISVFQLEFSTASIAAILTIFGYSLNDTIVVFDRIRENAKLMQDSNIRKIIDTSITQSLSRTIITSLTTLLAVLALYIFATGPIQLFALNMIFGVVIGTYSSIFIASPVYLGISNSLSKRKSIRDEQKYGAIAAAKKESEPVQGSASENRIIEIPQLERKLKGKRKKKK